MVSIYVTNIITLNTLCTLCETYLFLSLVLPTQSLARNSRLWHWRYCQHTPGQRSIGPFLVFPVPIFVVLLAVALHLLLRGEKWKGHKGDDRKSKVVVFGFRGGRRRRPSFDRTEL